MKFVKVDELPKRRSKKNLRVFLDEFICSNIKVAKVDFKSDEYKSAKTRRHCLSLAIKRDFYPIKVTQIGDEVFFIRTDM